MATVRMPDVKKAMFEAAYDHEKTAEGLRGDPNTFVHDTKVWYEGGSIVIEGLIRQFGWDGEYEKYRNRRDAEA